MIFINATRKIKHFRHFDITTCSTEPETEEHLSMKENIIVLLKKDVLNSNIEPEVKIGNQIADIKYNRGKITCVIECQCSPISEEDFINRTNGWYNKKTYLVWVWGSKFYNIEKDTHNYFLRSPIRQNYNLFYTHYDSLIRKVKVFPCSRYIEETDFGGGYEKIYLTRRELEFTKLINPMFKPSLVVNKTKKIEILEGMTPK